jgi:phosphatidylglycerol:prolipoprotein diacylglycerol transferase
MIVAGIIGARIAYVAEHWNSEFADAARHGDFLPLIRVDQGGLMFYGGMAGAIVALALYARLKKTSFFSLADLVTTVLPLGHAFGRIGCFLHGCCYGRISQAACAVSFPKYSPAWYDHAENGLIPPTALHSLPVLPTQLFEATGNFLIFALLFYCYRRWSNRPGLIAGLYCLAYALLRFGVEALRGDPRMPVGPLSISQAASLALVVVGLALFAHSLSRPTTTATPKTDA